MVRVFVKTLGVGFHLSLEPKKLSRERVRGNHVLNPQGQAAQERVRNLGVMTPVVLRLTILHVGPSLMVVVCFSRM